MERASVFLFPLNRICLSSASGCISKNIPGIITKLSASHCFRKWISMSQSVQECKEWRIHPEVFIAHGILKKRRCCPDFSDFLSPTHCPLSCLFIIVFFKATYRYLHSFQLHIFTVVSDKIPRRSLHTFKVPRKTVAVHQIFSCVRNPWSLRVQAYI